MKTLVTKHLILRPLKITDVDDFYAYAKKPNIGPMAGWAPHHSIQESYEILKMMIKENEVWGITLKHEDRLIGTIGLHVRNFDNAMLNQKEVGYVIDEPYWGKGYTPEAVEAVLDYAFDTLELTKVLCGHATNNLQSERVIKKSGFIYTHEEVRNHFDHTPITIKMYALNHDQYKEWKHDKLKDKI
jgi:RimJ/RimL family protein N-acetyltransferase